MWRAIAKGTEAVKKIKLLIDQLTEQKELAQTTRDWLDPTDIIQFWGRHTARFLQTEFNGISGNDLVFLLLCHIQVHQQQPQQQQLSIAQLLPKVKALAVSIPPNNDDDADAVFQQCATALVVHKLWKPADAQSAGEKQKALAFGLDLGTQDDIYEGEEMEQRQGEEDAKAEVQQHETEMQARKRGRFLRWCSRAFLENWYIQQVALQGLTTSTSEELQTAIVGWRPRFAAWCVAQAKQEQPRAFAKLVEAWTTRMMTGIGAMRQQRTTGDWSAAYTADAMGWDSEQTPKSVASSPPLEDAKHPFCELTRLALAVTMFECLTVGDKFQSQFLVFRDELLERLPRILEEETDRFLPRRPVILQLPGGVWTVHNCAKGWIGNWSTPTDALLTWAFLMRRDFESQTVAGSNIDKWLQTVTGGME